MANSPQDVVDHFRRMQALNKLVGSDPAFAEVVAKIPVVSKADETVLITGETGSGKELVARAVHYSSGRAAHPFVALNCGLLNDTLLEDELFGHERGAFTDAKTHRAGLISHAEKGTLFLDEVDGLSLRAQIALLRILQDKTFRRLGATLEQKADIRFIAATNASLDKLVASGSFRADLYYRLCVFTLNLPPLRQRKSDLMLLAHHFLDKYAPPDKSSLRLSPGACEALMSHDWPGNVRELENTILRAIRFCQGGLIKAEDLGLLDGRRVAAAESVKIPILSEGGSYKELKRQVIDSFDQQYLTFLMIKHKGNISQAARAAGKERRELGKLLKKHRLDPKGFLSK